MPANHRQAEDRAYRLGQTESVTVEHMLADGTLHGFIAEFLKAKLAVIGAVERDLPPDESVLGVLNTKLRALGPALLQESKLESATGEVRDRLEALAKAPVGAGAGAAASRQDLLEKGMREFRSSRDPSQVHRVTFGRGGHLECSCDVFRRRGNCTHVGAVRVGRQEFGWQ